MEVQEKLAWAIKARNVSAIKRLLCNSKSKEEKLSVLKVAFENPIDRYHVVEDEVPSTATEYKEEDEFRSEVVDMIMALSTQDTIIEQYLAQKMEAAMKGQFPNDVIVKIGSGPEGRPLDCYYCANTDPYQMKFCLKQGNLRCGKCGLAGYCSVSCQKAHWKVHKKACVNSGFLSSNWQPHWVIEQRPPMFMSQSLPQVQFGLGVHLWGNTPAFDLIGWKQNEYKEKAEWLKPMNIAFAASGDFRSMVETLASIPANYQQPVTVVLNDKHEVVVARNVLMLSLLLFKGQEAIDAVIAMWYSAAMPHFQYLNIATFVTDHLLPLSKRKQTNLQYGNSKIEFNQLGDSFQRIGHMMLNQLDVQDALNIRNSVMIDPSRQDYTDRHLVGLQDYHRESFDRFRCHGLVLPFDCINVHHNYPNRFLFLPQLGWLTNDSSDPKEGWDMLKVMEFGDKMNLPKNDLYGRLFFYIRDRLTKMVATIRRVPIKFRLFQKDAKILAKDFIKEGIKFDRVDVSNISDKNYVGIDAVLNGWGPLLNKSNPNSAIVTLFLNWYHHLTGTGDPNEKAMADKMGKAMAMIGLDRSNLVSQLSSPSTFFLLQDTVLALTDLSDDFDKYMKKELKKKPEYLKQRMNHTIVPHQVMYPIEADRKDTIDSLPASDQYYVLNWSTNLSTRYVEWTFS